MVINLFFFSRNVARWSLWRSSLTAWITLIKPFNTDLYYLISYLPISTNHFPQKRDCFQIHSDYFFFLFLQNIVKWVKTSDKMVIVDRTMTCALMCTCLKLVKQSHSSFKLRRNSFSMIAATAREKSNRWDHETVELYWIVSIYVKQA